MKTMVAGQLKDGFVESGLNKKKDGDVRKKRILDTLFVLQSETNKILQKMEGKLAPREVGSMHSVYVLHFDACHFFPFTFFSFAFSF